MEKYNPDARMIEVGTSSRKRGSHMIFRIKTPYDHCGGLEWVNGYRQFSPDGILQWIEQNPNLDIRYGNGTREKLDTFVQARRESREFKKTIMGLLIAKIYYSPESLAENF